MFRRVFLIATAIVSCTEPTAPLPLGPPGLTIVAGNNVTDTAFAVLPKALIVEVRAVDGRPLRDTEVRFTGVPYDPPQGVFTEVWSRQLDSFFLRPQTIDTTDAYGRARVQVQLGRIAGSGRMVVDVPSTGAVDTARFTVVPAKATRVVADVQDTTITATGGLTLGVRVVDRFNNVRDDAVTFAASGGGISVDGDGHVSTTVPARAFVVATSGALADTTHISVVPAGTFAAVLEEGNNSISLVTLQLDGTGLTTVTTLQHGLARPSWHPSGDLIVFEQEVNPAITGVRLFITDMQGQRRRAVTSDTSLVRERNGHFSPDGQWVYFDGNSVSYRVRLDGTGAERVPTPPGITSTFGPDLSPDGVHVAVSGIVIQDVGGTTMTRLPTAGIFPRYSPDGTRLLYNTGDNQALGVVNADGSGARELVTTSRYNPLIPPSWSADGNWILIRGSSRLELVRVADGEIIPLPYSGWLFQPSLRR